MSNKKLDAYLRKELRKIGRDYKREKDRCARLYPDWKDDEFNMLDNLFIWGYNIDPNIIPSFYSWDDAYVYYNRAAKKYYMTVDTGFYGCSYNAEVGRVEIQRLEQIEKAFGNFLTEKGFTKMPEIFPFEDPALEAYSLEELYIKFNIMLEGYKGYRYNQHTYPSKPCNEPQS